VLPIPEHQLKNNFAGFTAGFGTGGGNGDDVVVGGTFQA